MSLSQPELLSLDMIWDGAPHNAFTDLARHRGSWFCSFREAPAHALCAGGIRLLRSEDGLSWKSAASFALSGVDLRDPKISKGPVGTIDLVMGASPIRKGRYEGRKTLQTRSVEGGSWTPLRQVSEEGDWIWRVDRSGGRSYGISYRLPSPRRWTVTLLASDDGFAYRDLAPLEVPGKPNEATLRFRGREAIALVRREAGNGRAWIGKSAPPYREWRWEETKERVGGPDFIVLPDLSLVAAARIWRRGKPRVAVCSMTGASLTPLLELPSGGDCGYPGMVHHRGVLWLSYYSSHEGKSKIYLAKVKLPSA